MTNNKKKSISFGCFLSFWPISELILCRNKVTIGSQFNNSHITFLHTHTYWEYFPFYVFNSLNLYFPNLSENVLTRLTSRPNNEQIVRMPLTNQNQIKNVVNFMKRYQPLFNICYSFSIYRDEKVYYFTKRTLQTVNSSLYLKKSKINPNVFFLLCPIDSYFISIHLNLWKF